MTNGGYEFSGKTIEDAIADGLSSLGLAENEVDIEIVHRGSRGILGFGSEPAVVRISPKRVDNGATLDTASTEDAVAPGAAQAVTANEVLTNIADDSTMDSAVDSGVGADVDSDDDELEDALGDDNFEDDDLEDGESEDDEFEDDVAEVSDQELVEMASAMLAKVVSLMGFEAEIVAGWQEEDEESNGPYLLLDIRGDDLGALIGRRGDALAALQYLLRLMVNQRLRQWKNIVVDVEQYKQRRVTQLTQLAHRMADQVRDTGRSVALEPMPANERRIIHLALRDDQDVFTESIGEDERRKVTIAPRHS
ncbi:MAG: protein jag [Caldilineaceae bacterium]|nr:protein jag [Caldilineaceae bacterium]